MEFAVLLFAHQKGELLMLQGTGSDPSEKISSKRLRMLFELSNHLQGLMDSENFYDEVVEIIQGQFHYYAAQLWTVAQDNSATLRNLHGVRHTQNGGHHGGSQSGQNQNDEA